jgi:hypothetical protein
MIFLYSLFIYFKLLTKILIVALFLYSKLTPHKNLLDLKYKKIYNAFDLFFKPILAFLGKLFKPFKVGHGLSVDITQIILIIILLIFL